MKKTIAILASALSFFVSTTALAGPYCVVNRIRDCSFWDRAQCESIAAAIGARCEANIARGR